MVLFFRSNYCQFSFMFQMLSNGTFLHFKSFEKLMFFCTYFNFLSKAMIMVLLFFLLLQFPLLRKCDHGTSVVFQIFSKIQISILETEPHGCIFGTVSLNTILTTVGLSFTCPSPRMRHLWKKIFRIRSHIQKLQNKSS